MKTVKFANLCMFAVCAVLVLASCAGVPTAATQRVEVPVFTPCVKEPVPKPDFEVDHLPPDASDGAKVLAIARDIPKHLKYELSLRAVIDGCT